eukprot:SAG31_NODE_68_length_28153_cov_23.647717_25_plen_122_part_00
MEERAKGTVERSVFTYYIAQVGKKLALGVLVGYCTTSDRETHTSVQSSASCFVAQVLYLGGNCVRVFRDFWLARWSMFDLDIVIGYDPNTWDDLDVTYYFIFIHALSAVVISSITAARVIP